MNAQVRAELKALMKAEARAFRAMKKDPAARKAWEDAADAEYAFRKAHGLVNPHTDEDHRPEFMGDSGWGF